MKPRSALLRVIAVAGAAALSVAGLSSGAGAVQPEPSAVTHTFASPLELDPGESVIGTAKLDENCAQALTAPNGDRGLSYQITATSDSATVVIATKNTSTALSNCTDSQQFTLAAPSTAPPCSTATVTFQPIVYNPGGVAPAGQQQKVTSTTLSVSISGDCDGTGGDEVGDERPAAPAVANMYINGMATKDFLVSSCQDKYKKSGKLWRGALIRDVADKMPKPESIKDDPDYFASDGAWFDYVIAGVDALCTTDGSGAFPAPVPLS